MSGPVQGVVHGGLQDVELRALGLQGAEVLDLSANLHPAGPHPAVVEAARTAPLDRYPSPDAGPLRDAIAAHHALNAAMVLPTPGATAALHLAARALLAPGDRAVTFPPAFGEYRAAIEAAGGCVVEHPAPPPGFALDLDAVEPAALAFLCHPSNPTGACTNRATVERLVDRLGGGTLVVDLAYEPFLERSWDVHALIAGGAPVVAVHSMTKLHAIPGLRLGYVVAARGVVARLAAAQPSWSIDAPALAAGLVAIEQVEARRASLDEMRETRERMRDAFEALGCAVGPGQANFLLVEVGDGSAVRLALLRRGFAVRDCASFGLPAWIRVAVPRPSHAEHFIEALTAALEEVRS